MQATRPDHADDFSRRDGLGEEYLQISRNILSCLSMVKPPVAFYYHNNDLQAIKELHPAGRRIPPARQQEVADLCEEGNLFLNRKEYRAFAEALCRNLGVLLTEHFLDRWDVAGIFYHAMASLLTEFVHQPVADRLLQLKNNMAVLCEYLWIDPSRAMAFPSVLSRVHNLYTHSAGACVMGLALYTTLRPADSDRQAMASIGLGLLLHDIGMTVVPEAVLMKQGPLINKERISVEQHTATGLNILGRLRLSDQDTLRCIAEHHERADGKGYPARLKADQLSLAGKIAAVADSFCAMISERPHATAMEPGQALAKLTYDAGYDAKVLDGLGRILQECEQALAAEGRTAM